MYEELLHAASRFNLSPAAEFKRPTSNLVKVASHSKPKSQDNADMHPLHAPITEWIGADCPVDFLNVWFPAHWAPIVFHELQRREDQYAKDHSLWFDAPSRASDSSKLEGPTPSEAGTCTTRLVKWMVTGIYQLSPASSRWTGLISHLMTSLSSLLPWKEGILRGVFRQKAAAAWFGCRAEKAQVTVLLPGELDATSMVGKDR